MSPIIRTSITAFLELSIPRSPGQNDGAGTAGSPGESDQGRLLTAFQVAGVIREPLKHLSVSSGDDSPKLPHRSRAVEQLPGHLHSGLAHSAFEPTAPREARLRRRFLCFRPRIESGSACLVGADRSPVQARHVWSLRRCQVGDSRGISTRGQGIRMVMSRRHVPGRSTMLQPLGRLTRQPVSGSWNWIHV